MHANEKPKIARGRLKPSSAPLKHRPEDLDLTVELVSVGSLEPHVLNARTHDKKQIAQIVSSYRQFGVVSPILIAGDDTIIAGHGRVLAAKELGLQEIPAIRLRHPTSEERRALVIADNRLAEIAGWDKDLLALELQSLSDLDLDFDLEITGFDGAELDRLLSLDPSDETDTADETPPIEDVAVTRLGDVWIMGDHRLICGSALSAADYSTLMIGETARIVFTDPPYNVRIDGHAGGKGKADRREFMMASGEMSSSSFHAFLRDSLKAAADVSQNGSIHFVCMDWRHLREVIDAGLDAIGEWKNLITGSRTTAGWAPSTGPSTS